VGEPQAAPTAPSAKVTNQADAWRVLVRFSVEFFTVIPSGITIDWRQFRL
jgi:hypothetical protein